jgi:pyruvate formate lyase activating enzyme
MPPMVAFNAINEAFFPDIICPIVFVPACNFRCAYCLNTGVVLNTIAERITLEFIEQHVLENQETFIQISGGEPCLHANLGNLVRAFRAMGLGVGLSTNGTYPERLRQLVEEDGVSAVAMDLKCDLDDIGKLAVALPGRQPEELRAQAQTMRHSIRWLQTQRRMQGLRVEFRTTLYPPMVDAAGLAAIAGMLDPEDTWVLQQFRARKGLLGGDAIAEVAPYSNEKLEDFLTLARVRVHKVSLRWP